MTLMTSVLVCFVTALTVSLAFTAFCAGLALLILLPTLLLSTIFATFVFVGGYIFYAIVHRFTTDPRTEGVRTKGRETVINIRDKANDVVDTYVDPVNGRNGSSDMKRDTAPFNNTGNENLSGFPASTVPGIKNPGIPADAKKREFGPKDHPITNGSDLKKREFDQKATMSKSNPPATMKMEEVLH